MLLWEKVVRAVLSSELLIDMKDVRTLLMLIILDAVVIFLNWYIIHCLEQKTTVNSRKKTPSCLPTVYREAHASNIGQVGMTLKQLTYMGSVCDSILGLNTGQSDYSLTFISSYSKFMNCVQISALQFPSKSFSSNNSPNISASTMYEGRTESHEQQFFVK